MGALPCLTLRENNEDFSLWSFSKGGARSTVRVRSKLICNDGDTVRRWALEGRGIILRSVASYGLGDCLRMTVGTEEQNRLAVTLLHAFMAA